jgi:hypothetical protein
MLVSKGHSNRRQSRGEHGEEVAGRCCCWGPGARPTTSCLPTLSSLPELSFIYTHNYNSSHSIYLFISFYLRSMDIEIALRFSYTYQALEDPRVY